MKKLFHDSTTNSDEETEGLLIESNLTFVAHHKESFRLSLLRFPPRRNIASDGESKTSAN